MFNDAYEILDSLIAKHGKNEFPVEEIKNVKPSHVYAMQWLIDNNYIFAHEFMDNAHVTKSGFEAYQVETLSRKDKALDQAVKEAKEEEKHRAANEREDKLARKNARRSWIQFVIGALIEIAIFFLGVYFGGATNKFQWFIGIFH